MQSGYSGDKQVVSLMADKCTMVADELKGQWLLETNWINYTREAAAHFTTIIWCTNTCEGITCLHCEHDFFFCNFEVHL